MSSSCDYEEHTAALFYVQIISIIMPIFCVGLGAVVVYMILTIGASGMGRRAWKANVRAILEELDKESKQATAAKAGFSADDLKPVSEVAANNKPSPLPETVIAAQQAQQMQQTQQAQQAQQVAANLPANPNGALTAPTPKPAI